MLLVSDVFLTLRFGWHYLERFMHMNFLMCHFVQGGADEGEDLRNAAIRELREETGVTSTEFLAEVCLDNPFDI